MMTTPHTRQQATQYDLMCAIDELLQPDFAAHAEREALLNQMFEAWVQVPAFVRQQSCNAGKAFSLQAETRAQRQKTFDARTWSWTRRVPGYRSGVLFIAQA